MTKLGRKPYTEPRAEWKVYLPSSLAAEVELLLIDPLREKVKYGARNELLEKLLRDWLQKEKEKASATGQTQVPHG